MTSFIRRCLAAAALAALAFAGAASAAERRVVVADPAPPLAGAAASGPLTGYLTAPTGAGPFPAVALIHSCLGLPENRAAFAATLAGWGYVALYVDEFAPRGLTETCSVDFPVGPADAAAALAYPRASAVRRRQARRRRRLLAGRRRRAGARRLAAARRAPARRRRLLPALRQPPGRDARSSDPHPRRRGRFGDAGRGLPAVRRRAAAAAPRRGSSFCPAPAICSTIPLPPAAGSFWACISPTTAPRRRAPNRNCVDFWRRHCRRRREGD